jgi:hypothetical protein
VIGAHNLLTFLAAALVVAIMPGPGIFYVGARTLAGGRREGLASSVGLGLGGLVHVAAGAVGISALVMASAEAFTMLKLAGAASRRGARRAFLRGSICRRSGRCAPFATASLLKRSIRKRPPSFSRSSHSSSMRRGRWPVNSWSSGLSRSR